MLSYSSNLTTGFPLTKFLFTLLVKEDSNAILLAIQPFSLVDPAVSPLEDAEALLLVIKITTLVGAAVRPGVDAVTMHHVVPPAAAVLATIGPFERATSFDFILLEVSNVL